MIGHATFNPVLWMSLAVLAMSPAGVLAQDNAPEQATPTQVLLETADATPGTRDGEEGTGEVPEQIDDGPRVISGMSILGNQEAPTSLVIVPWKSSEIGNAINISTLLDDSRQPVDREVFMRALRYYEIRSETAP